MKRLFTVGGLATAIALVGTMAFAAWLSTAAGAGSAHAGTDLRAPTATASVISSGGTPGAIAQGDSFVVYANITDAGSPASGVSSATANVSTIKTGATAVALPACSSGCVVGSVTYGYKSAAQTANNPLANGSYDYSITATDGAGNAKTTTGFSVTVAASDSTAPTGGSITANGSASNSVNTTGTVALSKTDFTDAGSGIASNTITRASGSLTGNACGALTGAAAVTIAGGNDAASLATGCYQYTLTGTDNAGNSATAQSAIVKVDRTAPSTPALSFTGLSGSASYNATQNTLYIRPSAGGTFTANALSTDADTNVASYTFGSLNTNGGANFGGAQSGDHFDYTFSGTTTAPTTARTVSATNGAGGTSANATYAIVSDTTAPAGGSIAANGGAQYNTSGHVNLSKTDFSETASATASGLNTNVITRATAPLSNNTCGTFTGATVVTMSGGQDPDTLARACYQYTLTGTDKVGNSATALSTVVKVDWLEPTTPSLGFSGTSANAFYASGQGTVFVRPAAGGAFTVTASSTDGETGVAGYTFSSLAASNFSGTQTGGQMAYTFTGTATQPASDPTVFATNNAGLNSTNAAYKLKVDTAGPTGGSIAANGAGAYNTTGSVALSTTSFGETQSSSASGIASNTITRAAGTLSNDTCGALTGATAVTVTGGNDSATLTTGCYQYTLTGTDNVGNTATAQSSIVKVDTAGPTVGVNAIGGAFADGTATWETGFVAASGKYYVYANVTDAATSVGSVSATVTNLAGSASTVALSSGSWTVAKPGGGTNTYNYRSALLTASAGLANNATPTWTLSALDNAGSSSGSTTGSTVTVDNVAITVLTITATPGSGQTSTESGNAGTDVGDSTTVTVVVCATNTFPCASPQDNTPANATVAAGTPGTWSYTGGQNLVNKAKHYAQATQTDAAGHSTSVVTPEFTT